MADDNMRVERGVNPLPPVGKREEADLSHVQRVKRVLVEKGLEFPPLPKGAKAVAPGERGDELIAFLGSQRDSLAKSFEGLAAIMCESDPEALQERMEEWVENYTTTRQALRDELLQAGKTGQLISGAVSKASDVTGQFSAAGLPSAVEVDAFAIKTLVGIDYATGICYDFEASSGPEGASPAAPLWESSIEGITGSYRNKLKILGGISTFGASATCIAKHFILSKAERSLEAMKEKLRLLEEGETFDLYLFIEALAKEAEGDSPRVKKRLSEWGVDVDALMGEGEANSTLSERLMSVQGKERIANEAAAALKRGVGELETFIELEKEALKDETVMLSLAGAKFGADLSIIILSALGKGSIIPDLLSSLFLLGITSEGLSRSIQADSRSDRYLEGIGRGAFTREELGNGADALTKHLEKMRAIEEAAEKRVGEKFEALLTEIEGKGMDFEASLAFLKGACLERFGLSLDLIATKEAKEKGFPKFIEGEKKAIVKEIARSEGALNVTARNALRTIAAKKGEGDKSLSKWNVALASLDLSTSIVGLVCTVLVAISLLGLATFAVAISATGFGILGLVLLSFAVGMGLLYYYKPNLFRTIFTINGIKASYEQLKVARRCFDLIEADHHKNLLAIDALAERVNVHLGGVELLKRIYEKSSNGSDERKFAEEQLIKMGFIAEGRFDNEKWKGVRDSFMEAQYAAIRKKVGLLKIGHRLDLGSFGLGSVEEDVASRLDIILEGVKESGRTEPLGSALREAIAKQFSDNGSPLADKELEELERLTKGLSSPSDIGDFDFRSKLLIFYATTYLYKEIEKEKNEAFFFFDSYNTTAKFVAEYNSRLHDAAFSDAVNRIATGTAHPGEESLERREDFKEVPKNIAKALKSGELDPLTREFLSEWMGIDLAGAEQGIGDDNFKRFIAMEGAALDAFHKRRELVKKAKP